MPREYQFLMGNVTSMNKQMGNISRKMKILEDSKKNTLQIKNPVTEIKNAFGEDIHKLDRAKEITWGPEDISIETSKTEKPRDQDR